MTVEASSSIGNRTAESALWAPERRSATVGLVLLVTLIAFENLGVSTAMPRMVADLGGGALYSWPFTAFLATSAIGTVFSGMASDRLGPRPSLLAGPSLFLVGLLVAGLADSMGTLLVGRAIQGLGAGTVVVAIYVLIALVYAQRHRPAAFAALAAAWVVPGLIGPSISGVVTEQLSWRLVFLGLAPLVALGVLLLVPVLRGLGAPDAARPASAHRGIGLAAIATAAGISGLTWAAQHPSPPNLVLGAASVAVLVPALRRLLPAGTLLARPGLPMVVLSRALLAGSYFAVEAFLPLGLTAAHGFSPAGAGLALTVAAVSWSSASFWQGRHPDTSRRVLLRTGFGAVAVGLAGVALVIAGWLPLWLLWPFWAIGGAGMGIGMPSISVLLMRLSPESDRGFNSSAVQLADMMSAAVLVGVGGVLVNALASASSPASAVLLLGLLMAGLATAGAALLGRHRMPDG